MCLGRCAMLRTILLSVFASSVVLACGGSVEKVPDPNASVNGSSPVGGGSSSSGGSSGGSASKGTSTCGAVPTCDEGDATFKTKADACLELNDGAKCYERSECGSTIWCRHEDAQCDGYPECNPGEAKVTSCTPDAYCHKYSACGVTIYCMSACEGPQPICDPGDTQVQSQSQCLQDDAKCYSRTTCGYTIWCTGPA